MNEENTRKLLKRFPVLYQDYYSSMMESAMCWGFDHLDGWFPIIWQLSLAIEEELGYSFLYKKWLLFKRRFFRRWNAAIYKLSPPTREPFKGTTVKEFRHQLGLKRFVHFPDTGFKVSQVKEKYGTLRFYTNYVWGHTDTYIELAEILSAHVCEECGEPGKLYPGGWCITQCSDCRKKYLSRGETT
jgi:hypothetical protein